MVTVKGSEVLKLIRDNNYVTGKIKEKQFKAFPLNDEAFFIIHEQTHYKITKIPPFKHDDQISVDIVMPLTDEIILENAPLIAFGMGHTWERKKEVLDDYLRLVSSAPLPEKIALRANNYLFFGTYGEEYEGLLTEMFKKEIYQPATEKEIKEEEKIVVPISKEKIEEEVEKLFQEAEIDEELLKILRGEVAEEEKSE